MMALDKLINVFDIARGGFICFPFISAHQSPAKKNKMKRKEEGRCDVWVADYEAKMSFLNDCMFSIMANIIQIVVWMMSDRKL